MPRSPAHVRERVLFLALLIALGTGSAYAANTVFSTDIVDGEVKTADLANNSVRANKIDARPGRQRRPRRRRRGDQHQARRRLGDQLQARLRRGHPLEARSELDRRLDVAAESLSLRTSWVPTSCHRLSQGNLRQPEPQRLRCSGGPGRPVQLHGIDGHSEHTVVFGGVRVTAANTVVVRACNVGASAVSVSDLGIRVVTFG